MRLLLGVSGGIAAYKALELVRLATAAGHAVRVVTTAAAERFVGPASFAALTGAPVLSSEWEPDPLRGAWPGEEPALHEPISHLALVERCDAFLVAPATANVLAKLAGGHADDLLSACALAVRPGRPPLVLAPAMNDAMWAHPATRANVALLRERGATVLEPGIGRLASAGEAGAGRLPEPADLLAAVESAVAARDPAPAGGALDGLRVLVTAGGTREPIDAVRFVGNRSSGRMGVALAGAALARGARVTLVGANLAVPAPPGAELVEVETAAQLEHACQDAFARCDVLLMAAAVADFRPVDPSSEKLKKAGRDELTVRLEATPDVLCGLAAQRRAGQVLVGFAAETGAGAVDRARDKLERKGLDAVVVNDVAQPGVGFDVATNAVTIVTAGGERELPLAGKDEVAAGILDEVAALLDARTPA